MNTVQDLITHLQQFPFDQELIILDVTDGNPEDSVMLYVKSISQPEPDGTVYLQLES